MNKNLEWHHHSVDKSIRSDMKNQFPCLLWFTGLSGSGKSTIAGALENKLVERLHHTYLMDGDNIRYGLCSDLGFSVQDRNENIRRIGEVASLMVDSGLIVLTAFISPFRENRRIVRSMLKEVEFIEIFIDVPLSECEKRDPKGVYKKARAGEIKDFTGINSPYEVPERAEISVENINITVSEAVDQIIFYLDERGYLKPKRTGCPV